MAKILNYWDYDGAAKLNCPSCGWCGPGSDNEEIHSDLLDVRCPTCQRMLLIVAFPTGAETRLAAAAGNPGALAELHNVEVRERRLARAEALKLTEPSQLPELPDREVRIDWDFEQREGETWTILRHGEKELWRELAFYEGYERFEEVLAILLERYGSALAEVRPTDASADYLYGDRLSAPSRVAGLNAGLERRK